MRIISESIADSQFFSRSFVKYVVHLLFDVVRREIIPRQWSCSIKIRKSLDFGIDWLRNGRVIND